MALIRKGRERYTMSADMSLRVRVLAAITVTLAAVSAVAFLFVWRLHMNVAEDAAFKSARGAARMYGEFERSDTEKLTAALQGLLTNDDLRRAFLSGDRAMLLERAAPVMEQLKLSGVTHWYFITPDRRVFLRAHEPAKHGDLVDRVTVQRAAISGVPSAGKELGRTAFALRVVSPWRDEQGRILGFMELGEEIDHFLTRMKEATGDEFGLVVKKEFLDQESWAEVLGSARNTWNDRPEVVLVDTTSFAQGIADFSGSIDDVPMGGVMLEHRVDESGSWIRGAFPIQDVSGRRVGGLFILHDFSDEQAAFAAGRTRGLFIVLGVAAVGLAFIAVLLEALFFSRAGNRGRSWRDAQVLASNDASSQGGDDLPVGEAAPRRQG